MLRREFLRKLGLALAATPWASAAARGINDGSSTQSVRAKPASSSLEFASAHEAAQAIRKKKVSSLELTRLTFDRIDRYNPKINAFAYLLREEALEQAKEADKALARRRKLGPFHGVPVHVKESFGVAGHPCTWGLEEFKKSKAPLNADVVERLLGTGAVLIGATNVPVGLADWQTFNPIYGTTNNPWNLELTPGGSSGGSSAALAAGIGYISVGSDIGGSIRIPSHFCGIYGHKPTLDLVSGNGHSPGGDQGSPGYTALLSACGPMARSAVDLREALKVLGGPSGYDAKAWKWELPAARQQHLRDYRVGYVLEDPFAPVTPASQTVLESVIQTLDRLGVKLRKGWPAGFEPEELLKNYRFLLGALLFDVEEQEAERKKHEIDRSPGLKPFIEWQTHNQRRLDYRARWQAHFREIDVFLSPITITEAFPHDHRDWDKRTIPSPTAPRPYGELLNWVSIPTLTGCPATTAPVGRTKGSLPVGIQVMGPFWEDSTPITFAELLAREVGGFTPPPGYSS
jgi:amidase